MTGNKENGNIERFFTKKSYEICYALFRVAAHVKRKSFAEHIEKEGLALLESAALGNRGLASQILDALRYSLKLGADTGVIHNANAELIKREAEELNAAIAEFGKISSYELPNAAKAEEAQLDDIFTADNRFANGERNSGATEKNLTKTDDVMRPFADARDDNAGIDNGALGNYISRQDNISGKTESRLSLENGNGGNGYGAAKAAIRQTMILERIRQNGNLPGRQAGCRLKELQEILPGVSERTIRYDLQHLLGRGVVERIGNGGPATTYRAIQ